MKVYALNASPRKGWNSDEMLDSLIQGVRDSADYIDVEKVNIYDMDYKGCRSCFACQLKATENGHCLFHDGAYDLIRGIKSGDGLVFAAPVYYFDVPSQMRAILERIFYPGNADHEIPVTAIYTMNQRQKVMDQYFKRHLDDIAFFFRNQFHTEPDQLYIHNTLHWKKPEKYLFPLDQYEDKAQYHESQYPVDLQSCYDAGVRFAGKVKAVAQKRSK